MQDNQGGVRAVRSKDFLSEHTRLYDSCVSSCLACNFSTFCTNEPPLSLDAIQTRTHFKSTCSSLGN